MGFEPTTPTWQGCALPLSYTRVASTKSGGLRLSQTAGWWYNPSRVAAQDMQSGVLLGHSPDI